MFPNSGSFAMKHSFFNSPIETNILHSDAKRRRSLLICWYLSSWEFCLAQTVPFQHGYTASVFRDARNLDEIEHQEQLLQTLNANGRNEVLLRIWASREQAMLKYCSWTSSETISAISKILSMWQPNTRWKGPKLCQTLVVQWSCRYWCSMSYPFLYKWTL
jgi:hypothetical protein